MALSLPASLALAAAAALAGTPPAPQEPVLPLQSAQARQTEIAARLTSYVAFCDAYAKAEYRADCLAERFSLAADGLGRYGQTADLYMALKRASRDLTRVSRRYATPEAPAIVLSSPEFTTTRPIQPVATANLAPANAAAEAVLQEAELTLLRSSSRSPDVLAFAEVAEVIGSAKVLLRSG